MHPLQASYTRTHGWFRYCEFVETHHPDWFVNHDAMFGEPTWRFCETLYTESHGEAKHTCDTHTDLMSTPTGTPARSPLTLELPMGDPAALTDLPTGPSSMPPTSPQTSTPATPSVLEVTRVQTLN